MGKTQVTPTMPATPPLMSLAGRLKGNDKRKCLRRSSKKKKKNVIHNSNRQTDEFGKLVKDTSSLYSDDLHHRGFDKHEFWTV